MKILVVDDSITLRSLIETILVNEGYEVLSATNGLEAFDIVHKHDPDLIILDRMMNKISGDEVCHTLKNRDKTKHIPIIMLTAKAGTAERIKGIALGADDYITKPFSQELLVAKIKAFLRIKAIQDELRLTNAKLETTNLHLEKRINELHTIYEVGKMISSILDLPELLQFIIQTVTKELASEKGSIMLMVNDEELEVKAVSDNGAGISHLVGSRIRIGTGVAGLVAQNGKPLIIHDINKDPRFANMARGDYLSRSFLCVPLKTHGKLIGVVNVTNKQSRQSYNYNDLAMLSTLANHAAISVENANLYRDLQNSYLDTIRAFAMAVEAKDPYTRGHSERVTRFSLLLAKHINLDEKTCQSIKVAGMLHDIGKIGIAEHILNKPNQLTNDEFDIIKKHPIIGESIIAPIGFLNNVRPIIRNHHERYDGRGYPDGLAGDELPIEDHILILADSFDAMTSNRPYRKGLDYSIAVERIIEARGTQFHPELADSFLEVIAELEKNPDLIYEDDLIDSAVFSAPDIV